MSTSPFDPSGLNPEQIRRLVAAQVAARVKYIKRKEATRVYLRPATDNEHGCSPARFTPTDIELAFERARIQLEDALLELPKGLPHYRVGWEILEKLLGKDIVRGWRNRRKEL